MLPNLATGKAAPQPARTRPPEVVVFPYLSEQRSDGVKSPRRHDEATAMSERVRRGIHEVFGGAVRLDFATDDDAANGASDLAEFLTAAWPKLRRVNFLVTHRNFLANEVLQRAGLSPESFIPNAAVVHLRVTAEPSKVTKDLYLIRHCASHNNVSHAGSARMTTCANVDALRRLAPLLAARAGKVGEGDVLYGSSVLPRAVLSAIALQRPVSSAQLTQVREAFQQPAAEPEAVQAYIRDNVCGGQGAARYQNDYCSAKAGGTFRTRQTR